MASPCMMRSTMQTVGLSVGVGLWPCVDSETELARRLVALSSRWEIFHASGQVEETRASGQVVDAKASGQLVETIEYTSFSEDIIRNEKYPAKRASANKMPLGIPEPCKVPQAYLRFVAIKTRSRAS